MRVTPATNTHSRAFINLQRAAVLVSQLEPLSAGPVELLATEGPAVLRPHVKFTLAFIAEKDQNAQRFTYLCDALQWQRLEISKMKILKSLAHASHSLHTSYKI